MFDVAIIGYGPVGATLANFLGKDGWTVVVIEATAAIYPIPRAVHADDEAQRIFQSAGVIDLVSPSFGGYPPDRQYINAKGNVFFETHVSTTQPFGYQSNMYFHQPMLEAGLRQGVARYSNVKVYLNTRATDLTQDAEWVMVNAQNSETGAEISVQARYLVGCDGARSLVRKSLGVELHDLNFEQPWLVTDFYLKSGLTREDVGFPYAHQQICDPKQPISFIPNGTKNHYRFEFMLPKHISKEEAEEAAYVHKMLAQVVDLEQIDIVRGAVYTFHSLIAKQWRGGRIFIAGDAAHQMPPFAGQGMCSGLRDVHNLSWKLGLVLGGKADDALLDSYEAERKPHVTQMTKGTMFLGNLVQTQNPVRAWLRDLLFRTVFKVPALFGRLARFALRSPPLKTALSGGTVPTVAGSYFIQPKVTASSGNIVLLDDLMGAGFAILGLGASLAADAERVLGEQVQLRSFEIVPNRAANAKTDDPNSASRGDQIFDHTGELSAWFEAHNADFVLVRPDRFVFGAYQTKNVSLALEELATQLKIERPS